MSSIFNYFNICGPSETKSSEPTSKARGFFNKPPPPPPPPSVYDEAMDMLSTALSIYTFADLRDFARSDKTSLSLEDLEPPMSAAKVLEIIAANKEALMKDGSYEDLESRLRAQAQIIHSNGTEGHDDGILEQINMVEFVDTNSQKEMVHAIIVNHKYKRITIGFRGSVTKKDFITDSKVVQVKVDNPALSTDEKGPETINIHSGFYEYLFKKNKETSKLRCEEIMDSVKKLLKENPGYRLYCCGHSLGGALCTLFGFYAASDKSIQELTKDPIRVYSVASPLVGNVKFMLAFQSLERAKNIQHIRMANAEDVVTHMPFVAPKIGLLSPILALTNGAVNLYKHCGIKIHLTEITEDGKPPYKLSYTQDQSSDEQYAKELENVFEDGQNLLNSLKMAFFQKRQEEVVKFHGCETYEARLEKCQGDLEKLTADDLYVDKGLVGNVLQPGYEPKVMLSAGERISRITQSSALKGSIFKKGKKEDQITAE